MVTKIIEEKPNQVDLEDNSELEPKLMPFADSSNAALRLSGNFITWNADFIAFS